MRIARGMGRARLRVARGMGLARLLALRRLGLALIVSLIATPALPALAPQTAGAATPRTSLLTVEDALICVVCHEPLALAQSPEAQQERAIVEQLINRGETKAQ